MPKHTPASPRRLSEKQVKEGKILRRAIDKSEMKEPPTVGKPVVEEPANDARRDHHHGTTTKHGRA